MERVVIVSRKLSLVRLKLWALLGTFLSCWLVLRFVDLTFGAEHAVLGVAGACVMLLYFVRCEQCKSLVIKPWPPTAAARGMLDIFFPSKHCPVCGKARL